MSLTTRQQKFIEEYLLSGNASDAARKAGYSEKTAYSIGEENLRKPEIAAAIKKAHDLRKEKFKLDEDTILKSLIDIAFFDPMDVIEQKNGSFIFKKEISKAIMKGANFTIYPEYQNKEDKKNKIIRARLSLQSGDRKGALELLGQHIGMWGAKNVSDESRDSANSESPLQQIQRLVRERAAREGPKGSDNGEGSK